MTEPLTERPGLWQWPTILSIDAPAVALLWQWLVARVARTDLRWPHLFVLGSSIWLAYAADRWIEGWRLAPDRMRTQRHRFYQRHRRPVALVWLVVLAADLAVALGGLSHREFEAGLLLLGPVAIYLLSHQLLHRDRLWRAPKEVCVAVLLVSGVALFPVAQPAVTLSALAAPLGLFALLCFANCALISVWEHEVDETHGQTSFARQYSGGPVVSHTLPWMLVFVSVLTAVAEKGDARLTAICAATSAALLGGVDWLEPRLGRQLARVLADVALMTPLVPLIAVTLGRS